MSMKFQWPRIAAGVVVMACLGSAFAVAPDPQLEISTPAISVIKKSIAQRFAMLEKHLGAGVIGLTHDGLVAVVSSASANAEIDRLIEEENKDRTALYREIARANGHPEWEANLKITFGERFFGRARAGWLLRDAGGKWHKAP